MSTETANISILNDLKRTGQLTFFNPNDHFQKADKGIGADLEWTAEVFLEGDSPHYTFLKSGQNRFYDGHLYLDKMTTAHDMDGFTLFTFVDGVYQEITFVEHPFDPSGAAGHWMGTVKKEIIKFL